MSTKHPTDHNDDIGLELIEAYLQDAALQGRTRGTLEVYNSSLTYTFEFLDTHPTAIDRHDLKTLLAHLQNDHPGKDGTPGVAPSTINSYFSALNSYFKFLNYEGHLEDNPVLDFRERYIDSGRNDTGSERQLISIEQMATLIHGTLDVRNRAINITLAKTGIRRKELINIDLDHINWEEQSIRLQPTPKRSNLLVFFDGECRRVLDRWLHAREQYNPTTDALFVNQLGNRLQRSGIYRAVTNSAEAVGLHNPEATDLQYKFTPHCHRHWFTTHLRRSGMQREFIKELRGDTRGDAIDIYDHIDQQELKEAYLAHIPTLGI